MRLHSLADDAVSSLRHIRRHPRNFLLLALMLAVSVGSIVGIFDVGYQALHGELPYRHADRVVITTDGLSNLLLSQYTFQSNPQLNTVFDKAARYEYLSANLTSDSGAAPLRIDLAMVTPQFFSTLGVDISRGQDFSDSMQPSPDPNGSKPLPSSLAIILSNRLWRVYFGGNEKIVGHSITLSIPPYHFQVIGVAPPGASFPPGAEAWVPAHDVLYSLVQTASVSEGTKGTIGLLRPGFSIAAAKAKIGTWPQHTRLWLNWGDIGSEELSSLREFLGGKLYRLGPALWLATIFSLVLTIASAMSIFQVELETRAQEFNIRRILGATPHRLFRSLTVETGVVLLVGAAAGFLVRVVLIHFTVAYLRLSEGFHASTKWSDLAMMGGVLGIVFAAAAISQGKNLRLFSISRQSDIKTGSVSRFRLPIQVIPATLILITATMLVRSAYHLVRSDPGVQPRSASVCEVALSFSIEQAVFEKVDLKLPAAERAKEFQANFKKYSQQVNSYFTLILQRLRSEPGVTDDGAISASPYSGYEPGGASDSYYSRTASQPPRTAVIEYTLARSMTPGAIPALGMKLIYGRNFSDEGGGDADRGTVIVNRAVAEHLGGGPSALGQYIRFGSPQLPPYQIIGVVDNVHEQDLYSPEEPTIYYPFNGRPVPDVDLVVRTSGGVPNEDVLRFIQATVKSIAPGATVSHFAPLTKMVDSGEEWTRYSAYFLVALALLGLFLAGVCAWSKAVSEMRHREHEIGVRLALGAAPRQIVQLIAGKHLKSTLLAALVGAVFTWWFAHLMSYLFYEVSPSDLASYLIGIAAITGYVVIVVISSINRAVRRNPQDLMRTQPFG